MAHIFKHPSEKTKGIIVFSHKEMRLFFPFVKPKNYPNSSIPYHIKTSYILGKELINFRRFQKIYKKIQNQYFIGVHIGYSLNKIPIYDRSDFYLTSNDSIENIHSKILAIPLNSRNFTPSCFKNQNKEKYWDIICVSRNLKLKNLNLFLKSIKKIFELGYKYKILLICPKTKTENNLNSYTSLMDDYYKMFTSDELNLFSIIRLSSETSFPGLSNEILSHFYNSTKIFTLFSQEEGSSKVIHEALCCGLPVVVKYDLIGGGRDYLNSSNSIFFKEFEHAHETLIHAVENLEQFIISEIDVQNLRESYSIEKIKNYFKILYEKHNQIFDGNLINTDQLNIRLNGQLNRQIDWAKGRFTTADISSYSQFQKFIQKLKI